MTLPRYIDVKHGVWLSDGTWADVVALTARLATWSLSAAEGRLLSAIRDGEVHATLGDSDPPAWHITLPEAAADELRLIHRGAGGGGFGGTDARPAQSGTEVAGDVALPPIGVATSVPRTATTPEQET